MSTIVTRNPHPPFDASTRVEHHDATAQMTYVGAHSQTFVVHHPPEAAPGTPLHAPPAMRTGGAPAPSGPRSTPLHAQLVATPAGVAPGQTVRGGSPNTFVTHHGPAVRPATSSAIAPPAAHMTPAERRAALVAAAAQKQRELDAMDRELAALGELEHKDDEEKKGGETP